MKKTYIFFVTCVLLILTGVIYQQTLAQDASPLSARLFPESTSETIVVEDTSEIEPSLNLISSPPQIDSHQASISVQEPSDSAVVQAKVLIEKSNTDYLTTGWLHIASQTEIFTNQGGVLPNGASIPTKSLNDLWALLDSNGKVSQAVTIDNTGDPLTSQITVYQDGFWNNITFPKLSSHTPEIYAITTLDNGFLTAADRIQDTSNIQVRYESLDNQSLVVFSLTENFPTPIAFAESSVAITGIYSEYTFSVETGLLLMVEDYQIYPDGEIKLWSRITYRAIEKVDAPPKDILAYFEK